MKTKNALEDERRQFQRFKVKQETSFIVTSEWSTLGEVIDISEGGLAFTYVGEKEWPTDFQEDCMVFGGHDSCLSNIPMKRVSDQVLSGDTQGKRSAIRRRCVQFYDLSKEQKFLIECFIWINGKVVS